MKKQEKIKKILNILFRKYPSSEKTTLNRKDSS